MIPDLIYRSYLKRNTSISKHQKRENLVPRRGAVIALNII